MLTSNLKIKDGLFNGSIGEVVDIIYLNWNLLDVVMVNFIKYTSPPFIKNHLEKLVSVVPVERKLVATVLTTKESKYL